VSQTENFPEKVHGLLVERLAEKYEIAPEVFLSGLRDTVFSPGKDKSGQPLKPFSNAEIMAALVLADQYDLNPFANQIYIVRGQGGKLLRIVPVDGWAAILNRQKEYDGCKFEDGEHEKRGVYIECTIWHKGRANPTTIREYLRECQRKTAPWEQFPMRMLRHKALIQCGRIAFGLTGIMDDDEAEGMGARIPEYQVVEANRELQAGETAPRTRAVPKEITTPKKPTRRKRKDAPPPETAETSAAVEKPSQERAATRQAEIGDGPPPDQLETAQRDRHHWNTPIGDAGAAALSAARAEVPAETDAPSAPLKTPAELVNEIVAISATGSGFSEQEWAEVNTSANVPVISVDCTLASLEAGLRKAEEIAGGKRE